MERALSHSGLMIGAASASSAAEGGGDVTGWNRDEVGPLVKKPKPKRRLVARSTTKASGPPLASPDPDALFDGETLLQRRPLKGHRALGADSDPLLASLSLTPIKPRLHDTTTSPSRPVNVSLCSWSS